VALPIGLIGIVGEEMKKDHWGTLKALAAMGYRGIESPWGYEKLGLSAAEYGKRLGDLGLKIPITFTDAGALEKDYAGELERFRAFKCANAVIYWSTCGSREEILRDMSRFSALGRKLKGDGIRLCYHNHDHEFLKSYDGQQAMEIIEKNTDPADLYFELDTGWVMMGKADPAVWLRRLKGRVPVMHLKDFNDLSDRKSFTEVGSGKNDFRAIFAAAEESGVEWGVVEQDTMHKLRPMESVKASIGHLKKIGVAK
jgi:sugar phosphate isomerase/epimerase